MRARRLRAIAMFVTVALRRVGAPPEALRRTADEAMRRRRGSRRRRSAGTRKSRRRRRRSPSSARSDAHGMLGRDVRSAADENMGRIVDVIVDRDGHGARRRDRFRRLSRRRQPQDRRRLERAAFRARRQQEATASRWN